MSRQLPIIDTERFDAVIFDMDGVVTRTAHVHARAWKTMFDAYLEQRSATSGQRYSHFSIAKDYTSYVDGKPRYNGVRDFLESRGIDLPEGTSGDGPEEETIRGLGNRKNAYFQKVLKESGAQPYDTTVEFIHKLQNAGIKIAIISASKNARQVLDSAGVSGLFDARVDGLDAEQQGLSGKPAPDVFLAAAKQLGTTPQRSVVVEDARSGVQAARAGGFGLVIGIDRAGQRSELEKFADIVVEDLDEFDVTRNHNDSGTSALPSALERFEKLTVQFKGKHMSVFLDYDGTLTPIADRPELAILSQSMRQVLRELAACCPVAIVSGRDRKDVNKLVGLEELYYIGSHGFDIAGPADKEIRFQQGTSSLAALDCAESSLQKRLELIEGTQVERKRFAIAVHYRHVAERFREQVETVVDEVLNAAKGLRKTGGKMIFELRPDIDWDKGKALMWLLRKLRIEGSDAMPVYIGDDLTDEDALREIADLGIGILVSSEPRRTYARYTLQNTQEVQLFLRLLGNYLKGRTDS